MLETQFPKQDAVLNIVNFTVHYSTSMGYKAKIPLIHLAMAQSEKNTIVLDSFRSTILV